jgi:penicillin amidase
LNVVWALKNGDIGYIGIGKIPIKTHPEENSYIKDGSNSDFDWKGYLDYQPTLFNPAKKYIASANNKMVPDNIKNSYCMGVYTCVKLIFFWNNY